MSSHWPNSSPIPCLPLSSVSHSPKQIVAHSTLVFGFLNWHTVEYLKSASFYILWGNGSKMLKRPPCLSKLQPPPWCSPFSVPQQLSSLCPWWCFQWSGAWSFLANCLRQQNSFFQEGRAMWGVIIFSSYVDIAFSDPGLPQSKRNWEKGKWRTQKKKCIL